MSVFALSSRTLHPEHVSHEHDHHQMILATSGLTEFSIEKQGERITRERGCLIPMNHHHEYLGDGRNRTLVLDISPACLSMLPCADEVAKLFDRPGFFTVPPQLQQLATSLQHQVERCPALQQDIAVLLLRSLFHSLYGDTRSPLPSMTLNSPKRHMRINMRRLDAFIDAHLGETIDVETMARLCSLSPSHFHACFRRLLGMTPLSYVQERRMDHARALVHQSIQPLGSIAEQTGFRSQGSFTRAYRRHFGVPPSQHRAPH